MELQDVEHHVLHWKALNKIFVRILCTAPSLALCELFVALAVDIDYFAVKDPVVVTEASDWFQRDDDVSEPIRVGNAVAVLQRYCSILVDR